jgi:Family of unknown function (DUF5677)
VPLDPEDAANITRFFTGIKSLNELDNSEIRNVVGGVLNPTRRESYFTLNYHRAVINIELLLTLTDTKQFQAITMLARAILETAVELKLLATIPDAAEKVRLFTELEKLKSAHRIVTFKNSHADARVDTTAYEHFIATNEKRLGQEKQQMWPLGKRLTHWSQMNMEERTRHLGGEFDKLYQLYYSLLSWYVHSGITGVTNLKGETFAHLCGVAYTITIECYALILESIVDEFRIYKVDAKLKDKITFAKMVPFAETPELVAELRRALLGE